MLVPLHEVVLQQDIGAHGARRHVDRRRAQRDLARFADGTRWGDHRSCTARGATLPSRCGTCPKQKWAKLTRHLDGAAARWPALRRNCGRMELALQKAFVAPDLPIGTSLRSFCVVGLLRWTTPDCNQSKTAFRQWRVKKPPPPPRADSVDRCCPLCCSEIASNLRNAVDLAHVFSFASGLGLGSSLLSWCDVLLEVYCWSASLRNSLHACACLV